MLVTYSYACSQFKVADTSEWRPEPRRLSNKSIGRAPKTGHQKVSICLDEVYHVVGRPVAQEAADLAVDGGHTVLFCSIVIERLTEEENVSPCERSGATELLFGDDRRRVIVCLFNI